MGEAMVMGKCFIAKYDNTHDVPTITDLSIKCRCADNDWGLIYQKCPARSGLKCEMNKMGIKIIALLSVLKNNTGSTAFFFNDNFWKMS
jgi:hypothetical protein